MKLAKKLITLASIGGLSLTVIHFINKFISYSSTLDDLLSEDEEKTYNWRFGDIFYTKEGEGKPLLLIHDLTSCSSRYEWNQLRKDLSKEYTVYTIDLLGCGRSDKPNLTYTNFLYVQLICDFIKNVIKDKTDMIVSGNAGSIGLMSALNDDSIINQIILINPQNLEELSKIPTKRAKTAKFILDMPIIGTMIYNIIHSKENISAQLITEGFYNPANVSEDIVKAYYEAAHNNHGYSKYLFSSIQSQYMNANILHCLRKLDNSIYILASDGDPENLANAKTYKDIMPSIEIIELSNVKQLPHLESPVKVLEQIKILFAEKM